MARTYDPNNVTVVIDGRFITGFQEGSFVQASKDEENFSTKVSAQGEVAVALSNNPLGTITITLSQTSP
ncbi:phage structural protein, partial [Acinetobacter baumannii]|uniref:phage structural protein n=1 Tax=Acinetobacter baumannii TaxID=470 RepID=UPI000B07AC54